MSTYLLDGGLSTQLEAQGVDLSLHPTLWTAGLLSSSAGRAQLSRAHQAYVAAGCDVILSASYQTSPSLDPVSAGFSLSLALAARDAAGGGGPKALPGPRAFASLGPWGATQADGSEYTGKYPAEATEEFLLSFHRERLALLLDNCALPPDGLAFETVPSLPELSAILQLLAGDPLAAWVTFSSPDGAHLCDGTPFSAAFALCAASFAADEERYLGLNCVHPSCVAPFLDVLLPLARAAPGAIRGVAVYPNNGGTWNAGARKWEDAEEGEGFGALAREWRDRVLAEGLDFVVGGCCSTDATHIRRLRQSLA
jgi:homocysteine S-methyltransferase